MEYYNRHSIRLKGYDYSQAGSYFVTICIHQRLHLLGNIVNGEMLLNDVGIMVEKQWCELPDRFDNINLGDFVVMPNHLHGIITIVGAPLVGAQNDDQLYIKSHDDQSNNESYKQPHIEPYDKQLHVESFDWHFHAIADSYKGQPQGIAPTVPNKTIGDIVGAFKSLTTNDYIYNVKNNRWKPFNSTLWQRNYYEHIIRNERSYNKISDYIINNPMNWLEDRFYV